jgi:PII-like signaling protein
MGFGHSGEIHTTGLLEMSMDMPVVIEFFDEPDKVADVLTRVKPMLSVGHIVTLQAECL